MMHVARLATAFGYRHLPALRSRSQQKSTRYGPRPSQWIPRARNRHRAAGRLGAIQRGIDRRLSNLYVCPGGIELFGNDHRQRGLHALSDFRMHCVDDDAVLRDLQISIGGERGCGLFTLCRGQRKREDQSASCKTGKLQELTSIEPLDEQIQWPCNRLGRYCETGFDGTDALVSEVAHVDTPLVPPVQTPLAPYALSKARPVTMIIHA